MDERTKKKKSLKGQYFSFDAMIGSIIFILAIVTLLSYWHSVDSALEFQTNSIFRDAVRVSDLSFTPGDAGDCNAQNRLGFTESWGSKKISLKKLQCAKTLTPEQVKQKFAESYEISIDVNGEFYIGQDMGLLDTSKISNIAKFRRVATVVDSDGKEQIYYFDYYAYR